MGTYVVTGSASGMGESVVEQLRSDGNRVITVDLRDADITADLSTPDGRRGAIEGVLDLCEGSLDGAVMAAGVGPSQGKGAPLLIARVNYLGVTELLEGWRDALAKPGNAKVVVFSSNSTTTTPAVPGRAVRALLAGDAEKAARAVRLLGSGAPAIAYAASKIAVSRWVRREAVTARWAGAGIRLNALAPGAILTPLLEKQLESPTQSKAVNRFPVPIGGFGDAEQLAQWVVFMLSDAADFLCGSVVIVDGGTDAYFRSDDWPKAVPVRTLVGYLRKFRSGPGNAGAGSRS